MIFNLVYNFGNGTGGGGSEGGGGPISPQDVRYTGKHSFFDEGGGNWRIEFYSSGNLTLKSNQQVDLCLVGGGANGGRGTSRTDAAPGDGGRGGNGGQVKNYFDESFSKAKTYQITIGGGGSGDTIVKVDNALTYNAVGGGGASGGSGGHSDNINSTPGNGDAGDRPFGDTSLSVYGSGGGGGSSTWQYNSGGSGGPGAGNGGRGKAGSSASANRGGGGGGGGFKWEGSYAGGSGSSGIVFIRNHRP